LADGQPDERVSKEADEIPLGDHPDHSFEPVDDRHPGDLAIGE